MKIPRLFLQKKKLRASTARRSLPAPDEMDYEEMSEPNMKLSRALLIVLVLHVVAVAGIIAFNTIKSRQGAFPTSSSSTSSSLAVAKNEVAPPASPKSEAVALPLAAPSAAKPMGKNEDPVAGPSAIPKALPVGTDSGNFYVVAKGDNPVKIAKKLKVSESDLLAVNRIDDPRKLQIGQKLIIPSKAKSKATGN